MELFKKIFWFIRDFIKEFNKNKISVHSASASFFIVISSIPFLMLLLGLAKYIIPFSKKEVLAAIPHILPNDIYYFAANIVNELFSKTPGPIISITAITMLLSASRGVLAIIQGLYSVFHISEFGFLKIRIFAFFYTFFFILALILTLIVLLLVKLLAGYFSAFIFIPVLFTLLTLALSSFYAFLPGRKSTFKAQFPGALFTAALWIGFSFAYVLYTDNFSYIYGSLAAIVLLMLWLYICMNIFLCGAQINQMLEDKKI